MVKRKSGKAAISLFVGDRNVLVARREVAHRYNWKYSTFAAWMISARGGVYSRLGYGWRMGYVLYEYYASGEASKVCWERWKGRILRLLKNLGNRKCNSCSQRSGVDQEINNNDNEYKTFISISMFVPLPYLLIST